MGRPSNFLEQIVKPIPLTHRQQCFILEYLKDFNGAQAVIRAGYSEKGASTQAVRLLANVSIQEHITAKKRELVAHLDISAEHTLAEIARIAFGDIRKLYHEDGRLKEMHELDDDSAAAIMTAEVYEEKVDGIKIGETKKYKRFDKTKALEMLAKHFKIYSDAPATNIQINNIILTADEIKAFKQAFEQEY